MEIEGTKINRPSERRFGSIIFLLRLGGIPLQMKKISAIYNIYMTTLIFCGFSTYVGMFFDGYRHWDDLGRAMTAMRMFIPFTNIMWLYTYCRYVRKLPISASAKQVFKKAALQFQNLSKPKQVCYRRYDTKRTIFFDILTTCLRLRSVTLMC
jgi:hypothetical protein